MKYKYEYTVTFLWICSILTALWINRHTCFSSYLEPLFFSCISGSVLPIGQAPCTSPQLKDIGHE
jgi:hypothetical protein